MITKSSSSRASTGGLDAIDHLFLRNDFLAGPVTAALALH